MGLMTVQSCSPPASTDVTNIGGVMPDLRFAMTRANDDRPVGARDYLGKIVILYFGYTHCPDECPATLANLASALRPLGAREHAIKVLFATVDPRRDSLSALKSYVSAFAPEIDGLRGSDDAIAALARRYRVLYAQSPASNGGGYAVMHSDSVFVFDAQGHARFVATSTRDTAAITAILRRLEIHGPSGS
jgi:protein SCO1/2